MAGRQALDKGVHVYNMTYYGDDLADHVLLKTNYATPFANPESSEWLTDYLTH